MSKLLDDEIKMMEGEGYAGRWQRGLAWLRELRHRRMAAAVADKRCDWRSLFVFDASTGIYSLTLGSTPDDVEERIVSYQLSMAESERHASEREV